MSYLLTVFQSDVSNYNTQGPLGLAVVWPAVDADICHVLLCVWLAVCYSVPRVSCVRAKYILFHDSLLISVNCKFRSINCHLCSSQLSWLVDIGGNWKDCCGEMGGRAGRGGQDGQMIVHS